MCPLPCPRGSSPHKSFLASPSLMTGPVLPHRPLCMIQRKEAQGVCHPPGPQHHVPAGSTFHPFPLPLPHGGEGAPESGTAGPCAPLSLLTAALFPQERFVDLYGNNAAAEVRKGQETFNKWLLTGATVAGVLLLGSLLSRK